MALSQIWPAREARKHKGDGLAFLLLPATALLLLAFLVPLGFFFYSTFAEVGSTGELLSEFGATAGSSVVLRALLFTTTIALAVTALSLVLAYPLAYTLAIASPGVFNLLIACVVVPYFTSTVVRTYAWIVLLGRSGLVNQALMTTGLIDGPVQFMYNQGTIVTGMTYVLLPYMVLTLYATMRGIDRTLLRAAEGMGATAAYSFRKIFLPLTLPGIVSGSLIVFILSLGFFITPALMGGPKNVMIAMLIEKEVEINLNWLLAAILSLIVLGATMILYVVYFRLSKLKDMLN